MQYAHLRRRWRGPRPNSSRRWGSVSGGDGCGNHWVLLPDGRVGFVDTMSDPDALDGVDDPDPLPFVERILAGDQAAPSGS